MSKFHKRQAVKNIVSGHQGYIHGICDVDGNQTEYLFLHRDGDGDSRKQWCSEIEFKALEPGDLPPFDNPYTTISEGGGTGGPGSGDTTTVGE